MEMKLPFQPNLHGKTAVITGGGGVLCSAFAKALAQCGAEVALLGRTMRPLEDVAEEIIREGGSALPVRADVLSKESLEEAHELIAGCFGGCDILINGAGGNDGEATTTDECFDLVGRCCESGDILQKHVSLHSDIQRGDLVAVCTTGAYNYSMASNYNRLGRPPVVMLSSGESTIAVRRETPEDLCTLDV